MIIKGADWLGFYPHSALQKIVLKLLKESHFLAILQNNILAKWALKISSLIKVIIWLYINFYILKRVKIIWFKNILVKIKFIFMQLKKFSLKYTN